MVKVKILQYVVSCFGGKAFEKLQHKTLFALTSIDLMEI